MTRYVIITPVRDEEQHVEATIESVSGQTLRPAEWVIVDDGSSDRTGVIIDHYAAQFPWIRVIHRPNRGFRKPGGGCFLRGVQLPPVRGMGFYSETRWGPQLFRGLLSKVL